MTEFTFTITRVFAGSDAQKNVGIHATFSMNMSDSDGIIAAYDDLKLMRSKEGQYYIDSPFRSYDGKDKQGNAKKMKIHVVRFFPEQKNWAKKDAIVKLVLGELDKLATNPSPKQSSAPAEKRTDTPSSKTPNISPW